MEERIHNITMEDRKKLTVTKCGEVVSFNEAEVLLNVEDDTLVISGVNLRIDEVSKNSGDAVITGDVIDSIIYRRGKKKSKESIVGRIFK